MRINFVDAEKAIKTTMVGALTFIEEQLGDLWGHKKSEDFTPEEEANYDKFMSARDKILNLGHDQIERLKYKGRNKR